MQLALGSVTKWLRLFVFAVVEVYTVQSVQSAYLILHQFEWIRRFKWEFKKLRFTFEQWTILLLNVVSWILFWYVSLSRVLLGKTIDFKWEFSAFFFTHFVHAALDQTTPSYITHLKMRMQNELKIPNPYTWSFSKVMDDKKKRNEKKEWNHFIESIKNQLNAKRCANNGSSHRHATRHRYHWDAWSKVKFKLFRIQFGSVNYANDSEKETNTKNAKQNKTKLSPMNK